MKILGVLCLLAIPVLYCGFDKLAQRYPEGPTSVWWGVPLIFAFIAVFAALFGAAMHFLSK